MNDSKPMRYRFTEAAYKARHFDNLPDEPYPGWTFTAPETVFEVVTWVDERRLFLKRPDGAQILVHIDELVEADGDEG